MKSLIAFLCLSTSCFAAVPNKPADITLYGQNGYMATPNRHNKNENGPGSATTTEYGVDRAVVIHFDIPEKPPGPCTLVGAYISVSTTYRRPNYIAYRSIPDLFQNAAWNQITIPEENNPFSWFGPTIQYSWSFYANGDSGNSGIIIDVTNKYYDLKNGVYNCVSYHNTNTDPDNDIPSYMNTFSSAEVNRPKMWIVWRFTKALPDSNNNGIYEEADINYMASIQDDLGLYNNNFDLDYDGDVDINDRGIMVHQVLESRWGDANLDGVYTTADMTAMFGGGKYETGQYATWSQGDFDGDGLFTSSDLILALQDGGYDQ